VVLPYFVLLLTRYVRFIWMCNKLDFIAIFIVVNRTAGATGNWLLINQRPNRSFCRWRAGGICTTLPVSSSVVR